MLTRFLLILLFVSGLNSQSGNNKQSRSPQTNCLRGDCHPETGDLLVGRTKFLHASSTCGMEYPIRYCVLGATRDATKCFVCDSSEPYSIRENTRSHRIENIVSRQPGDRFDRWWQSENGRQDVFLQFDLEAEFTYTHIIMIFKTFRPAAMVIEKSTDYGLTWKPAGYFAYNCAESFPGIPTKLPRKLGEVYCESKYSSETPSTGGEVIFRVLPPTLAQSKDPYSAEIQDLLKLTNLRVNFTRLHTFGDNLLDKRDEIIEKYYYALYEMVVKGSCLCYGHASKCIEVEGAQYDDERGGMVHGQCQCTHNTGGTNCQECLPLYNDRPWKPARNGDTNECKKCECNNHARSCHFDEAVYLETNNATGGVCDDCDHNTMGRNCEKCKDNHWRDPNLPISDLYTCKPCTCDINGSLKDGRCDPYTDEKEDLVAGRCHCKANVDGPNCDRCKNGFFNLTSENPEGCEPCSCNLIGTTGNLGCDKITGLCSCKAFVAGRACDQCAPGYYGLSSDDPNGCKPCDCYPGGSIDGTCDVTSGQCKCRSGMTGRRCDQPETGFYCPSLAQLLYEAEYAVKVDQRSEDVPRPYYADNRMTWTGTGLVRLYEGSALEFNINNIPNSGDYEVILRYEQPVQDVSLSLSVKITRSDPNTEGPCANINLENDNKIATLPQNNLYTTVQPSSCLEANKVYTVRLELLRSANSGNRETVLLIDSILLVPVIESLPIYKNEQTRSYLNDFFYYGCKEAQISPYKYPVHEVCRKYGCSIGAEALGTLPCKCNPTGSLSSLCDENGGGCKCKLNVIGQKCDKCAPSTWGFGPDGCQACNCNSGGAKNNFCDENSGQCDCYDKIEGLKCDRCVTNHWQFPSCVQCNCNGFADNCNQTTGFCIDCKENTDGLYCENCKEGYYGRPTSGVACKECQCPGGSSGNKFADTCYLDSRSESVYCNCKEGYEGNNCGKCAINYYGNPLEAGGSCKKCECNGNIDLNDPSSCDQETGKCRNCLFNTDGDHCEVCKEGFFGNASNHDCRPCNCYPDGTEGYSYTNCDRVTGQCKCLPNVIGLQCDRCKPEHYGIASRQGCSECDCDSDGTIDNSTECDQQTGQCYCIESRGGRTCEDCQHLYWGDPKDNTCTRCQCSMIGSESEQCDRLTGKCKCRKGIAGYNCDRCDRGTYGEIPTCRQCGECFDDWTSILNGIKSEIDRLDERASNLAVASSSSVKDFIQQYKQLEEKLSDVKRLLTANRTDAQVKALYDSLSSSERQIAQKKETKKKFYMIEQWENPSQTLANSRLEYEAHRKKVQELYDEAMRLKESRVEGAKLSIRDASIESDKAHRAIKDAKTNFDSSFEPLINDFRRIISAVKPTFEENDAKLKTQFDAILRNLSDSYSAISSLNAAVCGAETSEVKICDPKCGGASCDGKCGTNSSSCSGLVDSYSNLVQVRQQFDNLYSQHESSLKRILSRWRNISTVLLASNRELVSIMNQANDTLNNINSKRNELKNLTENIKKYSELNELLPKQIEKDCDYIINKNYEKTDDDLNTILDEINRLAATINANEIEQEVRKARSEADKVVESVENASKYLPGTLADINRLNASIETKRVKNKVEEENLDQLTDLITETKEQLTASSGNINKANDVIGALQKKIDELRRTVDYENDRTLGVGQQEALKARVTESRVKLERTRKLLGELKKQLDDLTESLQKTQSQNSNQDVSNLIIHLVNLNANILKKKESIEQRAKKLEELETKNEITKTRIIKLNDQVEALKKQATQLHADIQDKQKYLSSCN